MVGQATLHNSRHVKFDDVMGDIREPDVAVRAKLDSELKWADYFVDALLMQEDTSWDGVPLRKIIDNGSGSAGVYGQPFSYTEARRLFFAIKMPHTWKEGGNIFPYVNWCSTAGTAGVVKWNMEYTIASPRSSFVSSTVIEATDAARAALEFREVLYDEISIPEKKIRTVLLCSISRDVSSEADTYEDTAILIGVGIKYAIDDRGSRGADYKDQPSIYLLDANGVFLAGACSNILLAKGST